MLTHQAIFFFRRNKNNNSNDRRFALSSRFFSLSLSLSLALARSFSFSPLCFSHCILSTANRYWDDILFFFLFSLHLVLHESEFLTNQITFFVVRRPGEKECVCVCVCVCMLLLLLTSRGCSAREKNVCTKGRELIKHFRRLLHDLLISQLKSTYTYGSKRKDR